MSGRNGFRWAALVAANVVCLCVLGFYQMSDAAPRQEKNAPPFANAVQQRFDIIAELRETNKLLAEQNALLRSGKLRVVIELPDKR